MLDALQSFGSRNSILKILLYWTLSQEVSSLKSELASRDQWQRLNNVEIKGVPLKKNENLFLILDNICGVVGFPIDKNSINYISRVPAQNSNEKCIIVGFINRYIKEEFLASARLKKTITAEEIGFQGSKQRIFANDHLTPMYKQLLTKTKSTLKSKGYAYIWVKYAKIHVRKDDSSKVFIINSDNDLNKLV
ncbi:uncharacterized protein LOC134805172 [Cydia splendana]|uniref:uncharacterized protein LOC134805172 n=1 Tax=Cydia splendana TaxID=1100963 RepID=UPI00300C2A31